MQFYHFTSARNLQQIRAAGFIDTTESAIGSSMPHLKPYGPHAGPDVVWLTDQPDGRGCGLGMGFLVSPGGQILNVCDGWDPGPHDDKTRMRIAVEVAAEPWPDFAERHGINPEWRDLMNWSFQWSTANSKYWFVIERRIMAAEWLEVVDMHAGPTLPAELLALSL